MIRSVTLLLIGVLAVAACRQPEATKTPLGRACAYLWAKQHADGGWRSTTHGLLRGGQAWTPFVLHALLRAPKAKCPRPDGGVERALDFLRRHLDEDGALGRADADVLEYPNYATAYALRVFVRAGLPKDSARVERMAAYLQSQQFGTARGVDSSLMVFGGWGFGETLLPDSGWGHVDLSHTRRVLQALRAAAPAETLAFGQAEAFLRLHQKDPADARLAALETAAFDGGFFASAVVPAVNKSMPVGGGALPVYASYATATADGLLALLAAGVAPSDARVQAARQWLVDHPALDVPAGVRRDDAVPWHRVVFFYHLAVRAEAYAALGEPGAWRDEIAAVLLPHQHADGHFANPEGAPNKEDDPLLATALAILALCT